MSVPVTPETRIGDLLAAYPGAEAILVGLAPQFKALKNPVLRRTVAKVATVAQAARVGGLQVPEMVHALRAGLGLDAGAVAADGGGPDLPEPAWLAAAKPAVTLDADALLAAGSTPVGEASARLAELEPGAVLLLNATFEPAPLVDALRAKGHEVWVERTEGRVRVWIRRGTR
jgi:hypothetical protein